MILKAVSSNILELRKETKLSQKEFAKSLGVCANTIYNYEKGNTAVSQKVISAIMRVYGVDVTTIGKLIPENVHAPEKVEDKAMTWENGADHTGDLNEELTKERNNNEGLHEVIGKRNAEIQELRAENEILRRRVKELEGSLALYLRKDGFGAEQEND